MHAVNRMMVVIAAENFSENRKAAIDFYVRLFNVKVLYDSDWFINLKDQKDRWEIGIIDAKNTVTPQDARHRPQGFYLTLVVDDVDNVHQTAQKAKLDILELPTDTAYGQRRMLLRDPNGAVIDVSTPIPDFEF